MPAQSLTPVTNQNLWEMDRRHSLHPWTNFGPFEKEGALVIARGQGCHLWDSEGRQYLDAVGGLWCTNIGLGRREMAEAIAAQAERLAFSNTFVDMTNEPTALLAAKIAELAPGDLNRVHFTTGGSTAVDTAVRMVSYYHHAQGNPAKTDIVARDYSYHGSTYLSQSVGKRPGDRVEEFRYKTEGIHHLSVPIPYRRPAHMSEVETAFGRLGHWFASLSEFGVQPDMITSAKGLTSGYQPLGAVIFSDRIWEAMAQGGQRWFTSGLTYSGHPVACAAALKNIEIMEREDLLAHATKVGTYFETRMAGLADLPLVGDVRGRKLMLCVENVANKDTKALLPDEINESKRISNVCESLGLLVRPIGHLNVMSPPLVITESQIDFIAETLTVAIKQVTDDLVREGVRVG